MKTGCVGGQFYRKGLCAVGCLVALTLVWGCKKAPPPVDTQAALNAVKGAEQQWSKAAAAHDLETVLVYYADGVVVMPPDGESASNRRTIRKVWEGMLAKNTTLSWTQGSADVSSSGDMVCDEGYYVTSTKVGKGKPVLGRGKYMTLWKKQVDGSWKAVADIWNSDLPPVATAKRM